VPCRQGKGSNHNQKFGVKFAKKTNSFLISQVFEKLKKFSLLKLYFVVDTSTEKYFTNFYVHFERSCVKHFCMLGEHVEERSRVIFLDNVVKCVHDQWGFVFAVNVQLAGIAVLSPLYCIASTLLVIRYVVITWVLTVVRCALHILLSHVNSYSLRNFMICFVDYGSVRSFLKPNMKLGDACGII